MPVPDFQDTLYRFLVLLSYFRVVLEGEKVAEHMNSGGKERL
jgi:hypothetical protein